jgi:hypothetical protein
MQSTKLIPFLLILLLATAMCTRPANAQMTAYKSLKRWAQTAPLTGPGVLNQSFKSTGKGQNLSTVGGFSARYELTAERAGYRSLAEEDGVPDPRTLYADAIMTLNSMPTDDGGEQSALNMFLTGSPDGLIRTATNGVIDTTGGFFDQIVGKVGALGGSRTRSAAALAGKITGTALAGKGTGASLAAAITGSSLALIGGRTNTAATQAAAEIYKAQAAVERRTQPGANMNKAKANQAIKSAMDASNLGETAKQQLADSLDSMRQCLINVACEEAGRPTSSNAVSKTYNNAVWMIQKMCRECYVPIAILLVLPGAVLTNMKSFVGFQFTYLRDDDSHSPFTGIFRSLIAIFLIPATQVFVSYVIDTANSLQSAVSNEVKTELIFRWAQEQIQTFTPDQQGQPVMNLPVSPRSSYRGKAAGMPVRLAMMEQMSYTDINVIATFNEFSAILSQGIAIANAFQLVFMCYLFLVGPIAGALFAWPGVGRDLFKKAFSSWTDGVVILALWKFWWNIVLLCMTVWLEQGGINPYDPVNIYYLLAFQFLLLFVPFSPFDFKPGEIVAQVLSHADEQAKQAARGGAKTKARQSMPAAETC